MNTKIIPSLRPKVGKQFESTEIDRRKQKILQETRKKLIKLAIEEKDIELLKTNGQFEQIKQQYILNSENSNIFFNKMDALMNGLTHRLNATMNKKVSFHTGQQSKITFVKKSVQSKKKRSWTTNRKKNRINYKKKVKARNKSKLAAIILKIKENNTVINLSNENIPDAVYLFLSKGLGYVPTQKVDLQDLKYDATEFIRKLSWKAFFKANLGLETNNDLSSPRYNDIRVSGYTYPDFTSPLLEEVKTKLFGWIANHSAATPNPNLSPLEFRGSKLLMDKLKSEEFCVTKTDKGGAILIMNFADVKTAIENELFDTTKFEKK